MNGQTKFSVGDEVKWATSLSAGDRVLTKRWSKKNGTPPYIVYKVRSNLAPIALHPQFLTVEMIDGDGNPMCRELGGWWFEKY